MQAMLATQVQDLGSDDLTFSIIRVGEYTVNNMNNKRYASLYVSI